MAFISADQAKQFAMTNTKMVFCLVDSVDTVLEACSLNKLTIPVVASKFDHRQSITSGIIDLSDLSTLKGKISGVDLIFILI